ncbi:MAG TPA: WbqC family protein [Pseudolabrys sp.]|nr:WbqC family protein [Pseudolabrys sp.]
MKRVAIMQPTYLPWSGYFGLMRSVDLFIFLDSVQFARRSWQQRNQIKTANGAQWLTVPVISKGKRDQRIDEVEIDPSAQFAAAHTRAIELNYRKAPAYAAAAPEILTELNALHPKLAELTIGLTQKIQALLGIETPVLRSSAMHGAGTKAELLVSLCLEVGATEYISPPGSQEYLDESDAFKQAGIPVRYFKFQHPEYPQLFGEFLPYMSCIDMLFNCGDRSLSLIESGCEVN